MGAVETDSGNIAFTAELVACVTRFVLVMIGDPDSGVLTLALEA